MAKDKNEMTADELHEQCATLFNDNQFGKIIDLLNDELLEKKGNSNLYNEKGRAYIKTEQYELGIKAFEKALSIDISPTYYYNIGLTHRINNDWDTAISYYTKALDINPKYVDALLNRGNIYLDKRDFQLAIEDYSKILEFEKKDPRVYYNRGNANVELREYDSAILDYNVAIELDPNDDEAFNNRGYALEMKGEYAKAFTDYHTAYTLKPANNISKSNYTIIQIFAGIFDTANIEVDFRRKIQLECVDTKKIIDEIRTFAAKDINAIIPNQKIAHYTKVSVADIFATNKKSDNKLRYYNAVFMNDPEEGIVVLEGMSDNIKDSFKRASEQEEDNIYIGSFLPADRHEDELVMWRTYGKDENGTDGAGCSMIIHTSFFDEYKDGAINPHALATYSTKKGDKAVQCLYKVLYFNKRYKERNLPMVVGDEEGKIAKLISQFNEKMVELLKYRNEEDKDDKINTVIDKVIYHLLSEIRFFFKSADYSFENEIRVIQFVPKDSESIQIDYNTKPKKVYVESNNTIQPHLEKVILGPKVPNPKQWLYLDIALRQNNPTRTKPVEVSISECKYQ